MDSSCKPLYPKGAQPKPGQVAEDALCVSRAAGQADPDTHRAVLGTASTLKQLGEHLCFPTDISASLIKLW